jgi:competence protein ComEC
MKSSQLVFYSSLAFITGIFLDSFFSLPKFFFLFLSLFGFLSLFLSFKEKKILFFLIVFSFFFLGILRHQQYQTKISSNPLKKLNHSEEKIELVGQVDEEPKVEGKTTKLVVKVDKFQGKVLVTTRRYPEYRFGDKLKIFGNLKEPPSFPEFNYADFLAKEGIFSVVDFPKIEKVGERKSSFRGLLFSFKEKFKEKSEEFIPPPQIGILEALIFGDETKISKEWKEKLNLTGTRHITAVSGMNITILCYLILNFVLIFGFWRREAIFISLFLIFLYVLMIGMPPSALRAAIMGSLFLLAQYFGRFSFGVRPVVFAAAFMLFLNPLLLKSDLGFQLSFLAILGLVYFQEYFFDLLKKVPNPSFFPARNTLAATFSAQIFTLPLLVYNFGKMPLYSPLTNLFIVPFLPHLTILIFFFGLLVILFYPLGFLFSFPVYLFLSYLTFLIGLFSKLPFSSFSFKISPIFLSLSYLLLVFFAWKVRERQKTKFLFP